MPEVNLLKDTENALAAKRKPTALGVPEMTNPTADTGGGIFGKVKALFKRGPQTLPVVPPPPPVRAVGVSTPSKGTSGERILSEKKHAPAAMIPLPEDEGGYNVNLLSDDMVTTVNPKQRAVLLGVVVLAAAIVVGLGFGGLVFYQGSIKNDIEATKSQLEAVDKEISSVKTEQAVASATVQKLNAIKSLVDRHTRWTKFFAMIEQYTLPEVTYGPAFSGDLNGSVTFTATTTTYEKVAQQYLIFQQLVREGRFISAFSITGATSSTTTEGVNSITFTVGLTLLPNNFTMTSEEFLAATKINTTAQSNSTSEVSLGAVSAADNAALICYLRENPTEISFIPEFMRASVQSATNSSIGCTEATVEVQNRIATAIHTDADGDGINLFYETIYGTNDRTADSGRGVSDAEYIRTTFLNNAATQ